MRKIVCIFCCIAKIFTLSAQNITFSPEVTPTSPVAASLTKVIDFPINTFTGTPEITYPLYTIKGKDLMSQIYLNYIGGNGIKVNEVAGIASLGWSLVAGGVITRSVREYPDESWKGYLTEDRSWMSLDPGSAVFKQKLGEALDDASYFGAQERVDLTPDLFTSTIGGRFFFGTDRSPRFVNNSGCVIVKNALTQPGGYWEILDKEGNRYIFGATANAVERTTSKTIPENFVDPSLHSNIPTSWYLSTVISPNNDSISFDYEMGTPYNVQYYRHSHVEGFYTPQTAHDLPVGFSSDSYGQNLDVLNPVYLKRIRFTNGNVNLFYTGRQDITGLRLIDEISIENKTSIIKSYKFIHSYFTDGVSANPTHPKLEKILERGGNNGIASESKFNYFEESLLPHRSSSQFDHWGYCNNNTTGKRFLSEGAVKSSDLLKCKSNILTSIVWPTGGRTEFEYEMNKFNLNGTIWEGGGLRIAKMKKVNGLQTNEIKYTYLNDDGHISGIQQKDNNPQTGYTAVIHGSYGKTDYEYDLPYFDLFDLNGRAVGYSQVSITYPDSSKEVLKYYNYNEFPDALQALFSVTTGYPAHSYTIGNDLIGKDKIFNFRSANFNYRGLLKEKKLVDANHQTLRKELLEYKNTPYDPSLKIAGFESKPAWISPLSIGVNINITAYLANYFTENLNNIQLSSKEEITYSPSTANFLTSVNQYEYNATHPFLLAKNTFYSSKNDKKVASYYYPSDFLTVPVYQQMAANNILSPTILQTDDVGLKRVRLSRVQFKKFNYINNPVGSYLPEYSEMQYKNETVRRIDTYESYDSYGNPTEVIDKSGIKTVYRWGYNGQYLIAKVVNAADTEILSENFEEAITGSIIEGGAHTGEKYFSGSYTLNFVPANGKNYIIQWWSKGNDKWILNQQPYTGPTTISGAIDDIRIYPTDAQMFTYTYKPLIGTTSETDPSGHSAFYEYDEFGRLSKVKDELGHILKTICYGYNGQVIDCSSGESINTSPVWSFTGNLRCVKNSNGLNTGVQEQEEKDGNPYSTTYNQIRWVSKGINKAACPLECIDCNAVNKKCINGQCITGVKTYFASYYIDTPGYYECWFHYVWPDGSVSEYYIEFNPFPCMY